MLHFLEIFFNSIKTLSLIRVWVLSKNSCTEHILYDIRDQLKN